MLVPSVRFPAAVVFATLMWALVPAAASAGQIDFRRVGHGSQVSVWHSVTGTARTGTFMAGELEWQWVGTTPEGFAQSFYSYCVDVTQVLSDPQEVSVRSTTGFTNGATDGGAKAAWLFDTYAAGIRTDTNATRANINAAALQVAIWEAMYDNTSNLGDGLFRLTSNGQIRTQAQTYLDTLYIGGTNLYHTSVGTILEVVSPNRGQDQIVAQVSEPSTLLMMGVAFIMFARRARRSGRPDSQH